MKHILSIFLSVIALGLGWTNYTKTADTPTTTLGAFSPTGGGTYRLQSSLGTSATTINLTSFKEPVSNIPYTMSYLNSSIEYATIEPQSTNKEFISFTGITQNSDGSATLTGVSRGLSFSYPYTASSTLQQPHAAQSIFILSNTPQLYNQYAAKSNNETITGIWTYSALPISSVAPTLGTQFANKTYVDGVAVAGAPDANTSTKGIVQLATALQTASSTALGSTGAYLVPANSTATDTPNTATRATRLLMSDMTGYLKQGWLKLSQAFTFTGGLTSTATTTLTGSNINSNAIIINNVPYQFPSSSSLGYLSNNGSGVLSFGGIVPLWSSYTSPSTTQSSTTTIASFSVPANALGTSNLISCTFIGQGIYTQSTYKLWVDVSYGGTASSTVLYTQSTGTAKTGSISIVIHETGTTSSQNIIQQVINYNGDNTYSSVARNVSDTTTKNVYIMARAEYAGSGRFTYASAHCELIK